MQITDKTIQRIIGDVLKYGVRTVLAISTIGGLIFLYNHANEQADYARFTENDRSIIEVVSDVFSGVINMQGRSIIFLAIIILFCTPLIRLLLSLVSFIIEGDKLYVFITTLVLIIIAFSMYFGFGH
ncbi:MULTISPECIES: DUF1634 domain-containing protein [Sphingobacterium]|uniref:DUF1634 domain-containing protein n=1 Tax=Sphingobacterium kitahiroshimense TaxID=470446 RepID=A0ABV0BXU1_9SPHI|nr:MULTISPECIES: DUF1634 domain-containing protein [Sphingobacterium]KKX49564.1 hypothetical protein L950_0214920 [Sphingobacterium sp. IITKGP-BTPF85]MBB2950552.1 putative membrane protein [Sphingobacterium sp. JUb56]MCW2259079.1 putative membrane protein [Sphingobacterium kitahiroshimense]NJI72824.1 DUF1634 domain-containing protein [Sphingobacterium sp. B16(2022)]QQD12799.1 DUF1634 domain-containing protein [Sphingobacterium sp. UDSM-2020]